MTSEKNILNIEAGREGVADDRFWQTLLQSCPVCLLIREANSDFVIYATSYVEEFLGITAGMNIQPFFNVNILEFEPAENAADYQKWHHVCVKTSNGEVKNMHITQYDSEYEGAPCVIVWLQDYTKMNLASDTLRIASEQAQELVQADRELLSKLGYEVRQSMTSISGLAGILLDTQGDDEKRINYTNDIINTSKVLLQKLDSLVSVKKEKPATVFSLDQVLSSVTRTTIKRIENRNLDFEIVKQEDICDRLVGNGAYLGQVLVNIIKNSIGFTIDGGITLTVTEYDRFDEDITLLFSVADTGVGIDPEKLGILFPQFADENNEVTNEKGLGIATCRTLVNLMNGRMWCESEVDKGTTVYFTMVCKLADEEVSEIDDSGENTPDSEHPSNLKILVVDDDRVNRTVAYEILRRNNLTATIAEGGVEAVDLIKTGAVFDIILMDIYMPDMDGITTTKIIREFKNYKTTPIIALTANAQRGDKELCISMGMNDYITKPFRTDEFIKTILYWANK